MNFAAWLVRLEHLQVQDSEDRNAIDSEMRGWDKETAEGWNDDGDEPGWFLLECHHGICNWHRMSEQSYCYYQICAPTDLSPCCLLDLHILIHYLSLLLYLKLTHPNFQSIYFKW